MNIERGRAWRRFKSQSKPRKNSSSSSQKWKPEKNWKFMYLRSEKLARAKQLGIEYPRRTIRQVLDNEQPLNEI